MKICPTCGNSFEGNYCNECGEKALDPNDKKLIHFLGKIWNAITFTDTRFLRSLKLLLFKPGFLAREYAKGRRKPYTNPVALFFISNLIYFLFPMIDMLNTSFNSQLNGQGHFYNSITQHIADQKVKNNTISFDKLEREYNRQSTIVSKQILFLLAFLFSIPVTLLFYNTKWYYFDHLIFSLNFISFFIYSFLIIFPYALYILLIVMSNLFHLKIPVDINSGPVLIVTFIILAVYLAFGAKRFYGQKLYYIIPKALILALSSVFVVLAYRFILFFIVMVTI